ncbi:hypothetical protein [Clostridium perfringens]|uniref:hypothetical protein n=1 Tax=Clostridium perfringens TaxID=1502 RepID=UPI00096A50BD|nr:hypothetical protein [Clostridium perfringens]MDM0587803.1 hypothetical protein [Clostridium perfringens]MDU4051207.1 hypothetical protein [Clostridium perfringens]
MNKTELIKEIIKSAEVKILDIVKNEINSKTIDLLERDELEKLNYMIEFLEGYIEKENEKLCSYE